MSVATKKPHIEDLVTVSLRVHRQNVQKLKKFAQALESGEDRNYTVAEVFSEYENKPNPVALRAYRTREGLTQKKLSERTGIPQRHLSEMENNKRSLGKDRARKLAKALNLSDYRALL